MLSMAGALTCSRPNIAAAAPAGVIHTCSNSDKDCILYSMSLLHGSLITQLELVCTQCGPASEESL